jgi:cytochrome P450
MVSSEPRALTDPRLYAHGVRGALIRPALAEPDPGGGKMLALMDPPRHDVLRHAMKPVFTPRAVTRLEPGIRAGIRALLAPGVEAGRCDFVTDVAARLPMLTMAPVLGIAPDDAERLDAAATTASVQHGGAAAQQAHVEVLMYFTEAFERCRTGSGDDLVSTLATARRGVPITTEEIVLSRESVVMAGSDTTRYSAASALLALLANPEQARRLWTGEVPVPTAVAELLRWVAPATHVLRTATSDTVLDGADLRAGDAVTVWPPSANRDAVFAEPDTLRLSRHPNPRLSFASGVHYCLGAPLIRLTLRVLLEELVSHTNEIVLSGPPSRVPSYFLGGLSALPVGLCR